MKFFIFKLFIVLLYLISSTSSYSIERPNIKNLLVYNEPKKLENFDFKNIKNDIVELSNFNNKLIVLNFWATWCAPCKEEMPSLDLLQEHKNLDNLKIFAINIGQDNLENSKKFFGDLKIKNLGIYFDTPTTLAKKFGLRGIPTSILLNKDGLEFARIVGSINFSEKKFIDWLAKYN